MEDERRADELEKLMSELSWLKRLASALVRDESDANDLVQETWLVAAEHAPTDGRPLKPWLSRVALNLVRMRSRASKRRRAREAAVEPSSESSPTPDELVSRLRAQRVVADEVLRFQVQGSPGPRMLVILGRIPTAKRGLAVAAGNTIDVGDVTVDEQPK